MFVHANVLDSFFIQYIVDFVSVTARMSGYPIPQVSWLKDNMSIDSNLDYHTKVEEGGLCSLTIDETFTEDSACFTCRATNPLGFAETTALLTVRGADQYFSFYFITPEIVHKYIHKPTNTKRLSAHVV